MYRKLETFLIDLRKLSPPPVKMVHRGKVTFSMIKFLAHQLNQDDPRTSMAPTKITGRLKKTIIPLEYR